MPHWLPERPWRPRLVRARWWLERSPAPQHRALHFASRAHGRQDPCPSASRRRGESAGGAALRQPPPGPWRAGRLAQVPANRFADQPSGSSRDDLLDRHDEDPRRPGCFQSRQQRPDVVRANDGMDRDHPLLGEWDHRRRAEAGQQRPQLREMREGRIHHQVLATASSDHRSQHGVDRGDLRRSLGRGRGLRERSAAARSSPASTLSRRGRRSRPPAPGSGRPRRHQRAGSRRPRHRSRRNRTVRHSDGMSRREAPRDPRRSCGSMSPAPRPRGGSGRSRAP